ncbi:MAG: exopolysaccharide biosynthesis protein [Pseudomonadota bacterium]
MADVHNMQSLLRSLCSETEGERVSVRDLLNAVGRRAYGPVLLLLGFIAISPLTLIPGANSLLAIVTLIFAIQIVIGRDAPWLPRRALAFSFPRKYLISGVEKMEKHAYTIDQLLRPRLTVLTRAPFVQLVALACVAAALVTIPLSFVPLGPVLPSLTILLFGLALSARDGFVLLLAGLSLFGACLLVVRAWSVLPFV